jgi:hypothetical protein
VGGPAQLGLSFDGGRLAYRDDNAAFAAAIRDFLAARVAR